MKARTALSPHALASGDVLGFSALCPNRQHHYACAFGPLPSKLGVT